MTKRSWVQFLTFFKRICCFKNVFVVSALRKKVKDMGLSCAALIGMWHIMAAA